jgi:hypothetical protein
MSITPKSSTIIFDYACARVPETGDSREKKFVFAQSPENGDSAKNETTAGYLLGETEDRELLKDPAMLKRLNDIAKFPDKDKACIIYAIDAMINNVKLKAI